MASHDSSPGRIETSESSRKTEFQPVSVPIIPDSARGQWQEFSSRSGGLLKSAHDHPVTCALLVKQPEKVLRQYSVITGFRILPFCTSSEDDKWLAIDSRNWRPMI
jgi:hypothetical protein